MSEEKNDQIGETENNRTNQSESQSSIIGKVIIIGFVGGIIWGLVGYFSFYFNFSELSPNLILQPFVSTAWKDQFLGQMISVFLIGIISIFIACIYFLFFKKWNHIFVGMCFGIVLWAIVFLVLNPIFPDLKTVGALKRETNISSVCLYILYGVFIGYSISFEYNEMTNRNINYSQK